MKYMGSKARIANEILPIILKHRTPEQKYYEVFAGGLSTIEKVEGIKIASDKNKYLIAMWQGLKDGLEKPLEISKELYSRARTEFNNNTNIEFSDFLIGWIGWMGSFNGRFFDGGYSGKTDKRNYIDEQIRNTLKQVPLLQGIDFICSDYDLVDITEGSIIYCDPPYKDTKQYAVSKNFDYEKFYKWCAEMTLKGYIVFVSEYYMPEDFVCIWSKKITNSLNTKITKKPVEKLFVHKSIAHLYQ